MNKQKFRASKQWKLFRQQMKNNQPLDHITGKPLRPGWNLHHMDLNKENYDQLVPENFICLNKQSHDTLHFLYRYYIKDPDILNRFRDILELMKMINIYPQ